MKRLLPFIAVAFLFFGCKKENTLSVAGEKFIYNFFPNEQACLDAQPPGGFFINCHQEISFEENGRITIMITDILWIGEYTQAANMIFVKFKMNTEFGDKEIFMRLKDQNTLEYNDREWKRYKGPTPWDLY